MKTRTKLFALVVLACFVSAGSAQSSAPAAAGASETMTDASKTPAFPYFAEITGDNVSIRSGPGTGFYDCGKFNKGDKVRIVGEQFGVWSKIIPPDGSFSWISMQYVRIDQDAPSYGIVTGDNVRVYAGSNTVPPQFATSLQVKLNKDDRVRLLGEQLNDYYKIAPPLDAYLWVSTQYTQKVIPVLEGPPRIAMTAANETTEGADANTVSTEPVPESNEPPKSVPETELEKYYALQKQIDAEHAKPINEQNYTNIKESLTEIANNKEAGKAARYAQAVIEQIKDYELAIEVNKAVKLQNEQLQKTRERIDQAREASLSKIQDLGRFAVIGKLENLLVYGPGYYRIVDESGKTICMAVPDKQISGKDLSGFLGKKVGLVGTIEPHLQTAGALIRFSDVVNLE
jgi:uncharacterized protein YgiM (DUF1202 family)